MNKSASSDLSIISPGRLEVGTGRLRYFRSTPSLPTLTASLGYLPIGEQSPFSYICEPPAGTPWESCGYDMRPVPVVDARYLSTPPSIEREGFELWNAPSAVLDFGDDLQIRSTYYPEAAALACAVTGALKAYVFDHLLRKREADRSQLNFGRRRSSGQAASNGRVHNDYTERSGQNRLALVTGGSERALSVTRFGIVNIWRSIRGPVLDTPLAVCDSRTISASDMVTAEVRYPGRTGEIYMARHSAAHRWYYFSKMDRHEALIFKQYDSQVSGTSRFTPHAAFDLPETPIDAPLRESIELRILVVYS